MFYKSKFAPNILGKTLFNINDIIIKFIEYDLHDI